MPLDARVASVRRFNRFYTQKIGILEESIYHRPMSLTEARVLYELAHREEVTASELGTTLALDLGYLSRILARFQKKRLVRRGAHAHDGRKSVLSLSAKGSEEFAAVNAASNDETAQLIGALATSDQQRLIAAMETIESLLGARAEDGTPYILRPPAAGDMGWVVQRHGALYAEEYGWDAEFEALIAEIVAKFIRELDAKRERCWIAERDGLNCGCVFLVKRSTRVAQLRLLLVDPAARGLGIGNRLVEECIKFARQSGYRKIMLWTNSVLDAARHIYVKNGFELVEEEKHRSFGKDLVGQNWELGL